MSGIRELRLPREGDQNRNGVHVSPVANSENADLPEEITVLFSDLNGVSPGDTTGPGSFGKQYSYLGYCLSIGRDSDPNTVVYICLGNSARYVRMTPGDRLESPSMFERIFVKPVSTLPNTSQSFQLQFFRTKEGRVSGTPASNRGLTQGAPTFSTSRSLIAPGNPTNIAAFSALRRKVVIFNMGPGDALVAESQAVILTGLGTPLPAGASDTIVTTADVWADSSGPGNADIRVRQEKNV